jgi:hypothetical protein
VNGDFVPAMPGDVFPLQFENAAQVATTQTSLAHREGVIGRRFLMNSAVQPQGERVTARQVSILAQELESMLGGVLSATAQELQEPLIRYELMLMADEKQIPPQLKDAFKADGLLKIRVRAGLEILNREAERERLDSAMERMRNLPDQALAVFKWTKIAEDWWQSLGLESAGRVKTEEEMAAEMAAAQQAQQAQMLQQGAVQAGIAAARQQPAQQE